MCRQCWCRLFRDFWNCTHPSIREVYASHPIVHEINVKWVHMRGQGGSWRPGFRQASHSHYRYSMQPVTLCETNYDTNIIWLDMQPIKRSANNPLNLWNRLWLFNETTFPWRADLLYFSLIQRKWNSLLNLKFKTVKINFGISLNHALVNSDVTLSCIGTSCLM